MNYKRRRRRYEAKRPKSQTAIVTASVGGGILVLLVILVTLTVQGSNAAAKWMAGVGFFSMFVSAIAFGNSIKVFRDQSYDTFNRWLGMLMPLGAMLAWIYIYFAGIIFG